MELLHLKLYTADVSTKSLGERRAAVREQSFATSKRLRRTAEHGESVKQALDWVELFNTGGGPSGGQASAAPPIAPEVKSEVKPEVTSEVKPEVKSEMQPEVKSEQVSEKHEVVPVKHEVKVERPTKHRCRPSNLLGCLAQLEQADTGHSPAPSRRMSASLQDLARLEAGPADSVASDAALQTRDERCSQVKLSCVDVLLTLKLYQVIRQYISNMPISFAIAYP